MRRFLTLLLVCLLAAPLALLDAHVQAEAISGPHDRVVAVGQLDEEPCCEREPSVRTAGHCVAMDLAVVCGIGAALRGPSIVANYVVDDDRIEGMSPSAQLDPPRLI